MSPIQKKLIIAIIVVAVILWGLKAFGYIYF